MRTKRWTQFIERDAIPSNAVAWVDQWKVFIGPSCVRRAADQVARTGITHVCLIGLALVLPVTETYLVLDRFDTEAEAENSCRTLSADEVLFASLSRCATNTQHLYSERFAFVPSFRWIASWTDEMLYRQVRHHNGRDRVH